MKTDPTKPVLALDLERTLIDDALHANPRPGLRRFLNFCTSTFPRIVIFTTVPTTDARGTLATLTESGHVPAECFAALEYVEWDGEKKDLRFIPGVDPVNVLLVDDDRGWICADQIAQWIQIRPWDGGDDSELDRVTAVLRQRGHRT